MSPRYFGAAALVALVGLTLVILGITGRFGIALAVVIDPADLTVDKGAK